MASLTCKQKKRKAVKYKESETRENRKSLHSTTEFRDTVEEKKRKTGRGRRRVEGCQKQSIQLMCKQDL